MRGTECSLTRLQPSSTFKDGKRLLAEDECAEGELQ